jgi:hypothetical protein
MIRTLRAMLSTYLTRGVRMLDKHLLEDIQAYLRNRYITQTHALVSNQERGQWCDLSDRIAPCIFDSFVRFVDEELGSIHESKTGIEVLKMYCDEPDFPNAEGFKVLVEIYMWIKDVRNHRVNPWENAVNDEDFSIAEGVEKQYFNEDTKNLVELIRLRALLWS